MLFDIRKIAIGATAEMPVKDVDGKVVTDDKGKELSITLFGPGSKEFVRAKHELQVEIMEEMAAAQEDAKEAKKGKSKPKVADPDVDSVAGLHRTAKFLAKVTASLNGFEYPGGAEALYKDTTLGHIAEDADAFVVKRGNFKPKSVGSSSSTSVSSPG